MDLKKAVGIPLFTTGGGCRAQLKMFLLIPYIRQMLHWFQSKRNKTATYFPLRKLNFDTRVFCKDSLHEDRAKPSGTSRRTQPEIDLRFIG